MSMDLDLSKFKVVYVEWEDSHSETGWHEHKDIKKDCFMSIIITLGYLLAETPKYITISHSVSFKPTVACDPITIPKSAIRKRRIIRLDL